MNADPFVEFRSLLGQVGLAAKADSLMAQAKTGIQLVKQFQTTQVEAKASFFGLLKRPAMAKRIGLPAAVGSSRIGGLPDVPPGFAWPQWHDKPLGFLAQINCEELAPFREHTLLPPRGILHFFYDWEDVLDLYLPETPYVYYTPVTTSLAPASPPANRPRNEICLPPFPIKGVPVPTFPDADAPEFAELLLSESDADALLEACEQYRKVFHQVAGYPKSIQGDVRAEFAIETTAGLANHDREAWIAAGKNAGRWRLLLQFDTDDDLGFMWGDAGTLYFCLSEEDLRAGRFDRAGAVGQCY